MLTADRTDWIIGFAGAAFAFMGDNLPTILLLAASAVVVGYGTRYLWREARIYTPPAARVIEPATEVIPVVPRHCAEMAAAGTTAMPQVRPAA